MSKSTHIIKKKNKDALLIASKQIGLEVNAENSKYMFMYCEQNAGQNQNIKIANKSSKRVKQFKYLGTTPTNCNCIHEEIQSRFNSGNACYHSVKNL